MTALLKNKYVQMGLGVVCSVGTFLILTKIGIEPSTVWKITLAVAGTFGLTITGIALASK